MFVLGQVVLSKRGRDKGRAFVIVSIEGEYLFLVDGSMRTLEKPKKKKAKHVQLTNEVNVEVQEKLLRGRHLMDSDIRKALSVICGSAD